MTTAPPYIDAATVDAHLDYPSLIEALRRAFLEPPTAPARAAVPIDATASSEAGVLLVMPAVRPGGLAVVKLVTVHPGLSDRPGGALRAVVLVLDAATGETLGLIDGHALTTRRTAATSVLAASVLARPDSRRLTVLGAGAVAGALAEAYSAVFPLETVTIWARRPAAAAALAARLRARGVAAQAKDDLMAAVTHADIVSAATLSAEPLLKAGMVRADTHVDLVGAFSGGMCEADAALVANSCIIVDGPGAFEAGDLAAPLAQGLIDRLGVRELAEVLSARFERPGDQPTLFKSVGLALEDLAAAELLFQRLAAARPPRAAGSHTS